MVASANRKLEFHRNMNSDSALRRCTMPKQMAEALRAAADGTSRCMNIVAPVAQRIVLKPSGGSWNMTTGWGEFVRAAQVQLGDRLSFTQNKAGDFRIHITKGVSQKGLDKAKDERQKGLNKAKDERRRTVATTKSTDAWRAAGQKIGEHAQSKGGRSNVRGAADSRTTARGQKRRKIDSQDGATHILDVDAYENNGEKRLWWDELGDSDDETDGGQKWRSLQHRGVMFPAPYKQHGIKILYGEPGKRKEPITLTPEAEEVATMYAKMLGTDYAKKAVFRKNFFHGFLQALNLGRRPGVDPPHEIQNLASCDFTPISAWLEHEKEKQKDIPTETKNLLRELQQEREEPYRWAAVDGFKEKIGNVVVEPPGLFRGRGEHPKMGTLKHRVIPEQVTLNLGSDALVPTCPLMGHEWNEVICRKDVTWLAYWRENIAGATKYVHFSNESSFKGKSDLRKFEKARQLKAKISHIRSWYTRQLDSKDAQTKEMAAAIFLIDRLALRVGGEKNTEEEADTVGCCSLRVEHLSLTGPDKMKLDFLGKDSIRFEQEVRLHERYGAVGGKVYSLLKELVAGKQQSEDIFSRLNPSILNKQLNKLMPKLTAKVFRTYNASVVLSNELARMPSGLSLEEKLMFYTNANTRVAILCNHQRGISNDHDQQMQRLHTKKAIEEESLALLRKAREIGEREKLSSVVVRQWVKNKPKKEIGTSASKAASNPQRAKWDLSGAWEKRAVSLENIKKLIDSKEKLVSKQDYNLQMKETSSTVSLSTSRVNYMDPRVTVAWCKRNEVPIDNNRLFSKQLCVKFVWAMSAPSTFAF